METFPTLSQGLDRIDETLAYNPSASSQMENGVVISRAKFTTTKKKWELQYSFLTAADKTLLTTLQITVMVGADKFNWTNPKDSIVYTVRFSDPIQFSAETKLPDLWQAKFTLIEA
jgi:hypothetical protein